jgi:hypothetical protein
MSVMAKVQGTDGRLRDDVEGVRQLTHEFGDERGHFIAGECSVEESTAPTGEKGSRLQKRVGHYMHRDILIHEHIKVMIFKAGIVVSPCNPPRMIQ